MNDSDVRTWRRLSVRYVHASAPKLVDCGSKTARRSIATDEITWIGSRDAWGQLDQGFVSNPANEFTDAAFPVLAQARWLADQGITEPFAAGGAAVDDVVARRPAQALADGEQICTGKYRFRMILTPHVPHCWEASLLFEETQGTLLCSDLFHQNGDVEPSTSARRPFNPRSIRIFLPTRQGPGGARPPTRCGGATRRQ